jgi:ribonucleoside-diphosphate reductase subunit M2
MAKTNIEPLLIPDDNRFVMFPIKDHKSWELYKFALSCFWTTDEVDMTMDYNHWQTLTPHEQHFIKMILAFFASSDGIVLENLATRFMGEIQCSEVRSFYGFQIAMENIHSEMYSLFIDTLIKDELEKNSLFQALEHFPCIKKKADWAQKWISDNRSSLAARLVAFACVEGIFFSGAFCSIYWLKKRGIMPGLTFSNELISRDEALHTDYAVYLYTERIEKKLNKTRIHEIIKDAVSIEQEFICDAIPCRMIGMNGELMNKYIQFVADRLSVQLGYDKIYNVQNPFDFMEKISLDGKTNFFEKRVGEYALASGTKEDTVFDMDCEF